jgi:outer membrane protein OmpA-like peptidoglycan-associated protein
MESYSQAQNYKISEGWEKYDFIPGYQQVFYDDFSGDRVREKPRAWELIEGQAEVLALENQRWLRAINETFLKPTIEALPAQFSLEMDFYVTPRGYSGNYRVDIYGQTDEEWAALTIEEFGAFFNTSWKLNLESPLELRGGRHHLAIMVTESGFKCFVDSIRVVSTPKHGNFQPHDFEIFLPGGEREGDDKSMITNVRLAALDKNFREQIQANGKIVNYGIPFAAGAVTPQPEAFATLKELAALLQNDLSLNLSIECHVFESDDGGNNNRLSQQRAEAIREMLFRYYKSDRDRLRTKGWGSAKPLNEIDTVDGRGANTRVEFVKR